MFGWCMFASFLRYFDAFIDKFTRHHFVVSHFLKTATKYGFNYDTLQAWGRRIKDDFDSNNKGFSKLSSDNTNAQYQFQTYILSELRVVHKEKQELRDIINSIAKLLNESVSLQRENHYELSKVTTPQSTKLIMLKKHMKMRKR